MIGDLRLLKENANNRLHYDCKTHSIRGLYEYFYGTECDITPLFTHGLQLYATEVNNMVHLDISIENKNEIFTLLGLKKVNLVDDSGLIISREFFRERKNTNLPFILCIDIYNLIDRFKTLCNREPYHHRHFAVVYDLKEFENKDIFFLSTTSDISCRFSSDLLKYSIDAAIRPFALVQPERKPSVATWDKQILNILTASSKFQTERGQDLQKTQTAEKHSEVEILGQGPDVLVWLAGQLEQYVSRDQSEKRNALLKIEAFVLAAANSRYWYYRGLKTLANRNISLWWAATKHFNLLTVLVQSIYCKWQKINALTQHELYGHLADSFVNIIFELKQVFALEIRANEIELEIFDSLSRGDLENG